MPLVYALTAAGQEALTAEPDEQKLPNDYRRLLGMIEVGGHDRHAQALQHQQQGDGVGAAGEPHEDARARRQEIVGLREGGDGGDERVCGVGRVQDRSFPQA